MNKRTFTELLENGWNQGRCISVGLDVDPGRLPDDLKTQDVASALIEFNRRLIEGTKHVALAYKPQSASYEALGDEGPSVLRKTISLVKELAPEAMVILDAKRADIGSTNDFYIRAAFEYLDADAITLHPYLGLEAMQSFLDQKDKGSFVLCHTSNPGAGRYQELIVDGRPLYQHIAADIAESWNGNGNVGLVVGATYPEEMCQVRDIVGDLPLLVPGIGAQGGDLEATVRAGMRNGRGLIIHASRSVMYAWKNGGTVESAARDEVNSMQAAITAATK